MHAASSRKAKIFTNFGQQIPSSTLTHNPHRDLLYYHLLEPVFVLFSCTTSQPAFGPILDRISWAGLRMVSSPHVSPIILLLCLGLWVGSPRRPSRKRKGECILLRTVVQILRTRSSACVTSRPGFGWPRVRLCVVNPVLCEVLVFGERRETRCSKKAGGDLQTSIVFVQTLPNMVRRPGWWHRKKKNCLRDYL